MKLKTFWLLLVACVLACGNLALAHGSETNTASEPALNSYAEFVYIPQTASISFESIDDAIQWRQALDHNWYKWARRHDKRFTAVAETGYVAASAPVYDLDHTWLSDGWLYRLALCENHGQNHVSNLYMGYFEMTDWAWRNGEGPPGKPYQFSYAVNAAAAKLNIQKAGMSGQHPGCRRIMLREGYQILS